MKSLNGDSCKLIIQQTAASENELSYFAVEFCFQTNSFHVQCLLSYELKIQNVWMIHFVPVIENSIQKLNHCFMAHLERTKNLKQNGLYNKWKHRLRRTLLSHTRYKSYTDCGTGKAKKKKKHPKPATFTRARFSG